MLINKLYDAFLNYKTWTYLAKIEIKSKYVGSVLGPFWITITQIVLVVSIGYIYGGLFNIPPERYMPFLTCGLISWSLISGILNEGTRCFGSNKAFINEIKVNPLIFCCKIVLGNFIIFIHNSIAIIFIFLLTGYEFSILMLFGLIGLFFILINGILAIITIGIICERFRDIPSLISNVLQISFFVTPIIWDPITFKSRVIIIFKLNPFFHFIEATRSPLLGRMPDVDIYFILMAITLVNFLIASIIYNKFSNKIVYWIQ